MQVSHGQTKSEVGDAQGPKNVEWERLLVALAVGEGMNHLRSSPVTQSERTFCDTKYKRLERGCFQLPGLRDTAPAMEIDSTTLAMILGGVDVRTAQRRRRYQAPIPPRLSVHSATADAVTTACRSMRTRNAQQ